MRQDWIKHKENHKLIIFVLGWGSEPGVVSHITPEGYDILITYDYRRIECLDKDLFSDYEQIYLFAWSFGVWVTEQIFNDIPLSRAIACGGTPLPVDDLYGIPRRSLMLTMRKLNPDTIDEFCRKVYGKSYPVVIQIPPSRSLEDMHTELEHLYKESTKPYQPKIKWDKAIIGSQDTIFPPENMKRYWGNIGHVVEGMPHYTFADTTTVTDELE